MHTNLHLIFRGFVGCWLVAHGASGGWGLGGASRVVGYANFPNLSKHHTHPITHGFFSLEVLHLAFFSMYPWCNFKLDVEHLFPPSMANGS